jgi:hypothetical protein
MKFEDAEKEFLHHDNAGRAAGNAMERIWVVRPLGRADPGLEVRVGRTRWDDNGVLLGVFVSRANGSSCDPFRDLTMDELRQVMACRMVVDLWVAGVIDDLPVEAPIETATTAVLEMVRGLTRAAEFKEQQDGGKRIYDDECRRALETARSLGWGLNKIGTLG